MKYSGRLIGLCGQKRSGKDTVAQSIMEADASFERVAFADVMKSMSKAINPIIEVTWLQSNQMSITGAHPVGEDSVREVAYYRLADVVGAIGWENAKEIPDVRHFLQKLGTEGGRDHLGSDVWVDAAFNQIIPILNQGTSVVVTDARFKNEIERLRECGGQLWRVDRPKLAADTTATGTHASEVEWRKVKPDHVILNDGSLEDLDGRVADALKMPVPVF